MEDGWMDGWTEDHDDDDDVNVDVICCGETEGLEYVPKQSVWDCMF